MSEVTAGPGIARRDLLVVAAAATAGIATARPRRAAGRESGARPGPAASAPAASKPAAKELPGSVIGRVLYDGKPPVPEAIDCSADPQCAQLYRKEPLTREVLLVSKDRRLQNVFVSVKRGPGKDQKWPIPAEPVVLDQKGCRYLPHVFGVMAGQPLDILNSSRIHEVPHGYPERNPEFSFSLPKKGMKETIVLTEPEAFKIKCDVHPWESTWCHVMAHPFWAVSDAKGEFVVRGLEPGYYELEFWHEHWSLGRQTKRIRVEPDKPTRIDAVVFKPGKRPRSRPARS